MLAQFIPDHDAPIDLDADQLTVRDVAVLARVDKTLIHNWISRGFAPPGRWHPGPHRSRHLYSICDALRFVVLETMCMRHAMCTLEQAALIANIVVDLARKSTAPAAHTDGIRPNVAVLVAWTEDGEIVATTADIKQPGHYYPPIHVDGKFDPLRRPHIYVPATALLIDTVLRTEELLANREDPPRTMRGVRIHA